MAMGHAKVLITCKTTATFHIELSVIHRNASRSPKRAREMAGWDLLIMSMKMVDRPSLNERYDNIGKAIQAVIDKLQLTEVQHSYEFSDVDNKDSVY